MQYIWQQQLDLLFILVGFVFCYKRRLLKRTCWIASSILDSNNSNVCQWDDGRVFWHSHALKKESLALNFERWAPFSAHGYKMWNDVNQLQWIPLKKKKNNNDENLKTDIKEKKNPVGDILCLCETP